jgi:hypothetical protein
MGIADGGAHAPSTPDSLLRRRVGILHRFVRQRELDGHGVATHSSFTTAFPCSCESSAEVTKRRGLARIPQQLNVPKDPRVSRSAGLEAFRTAATAGGTCVQGAAPQGGRRTRARAARCLPLLLCYAALRG